MLPSTGTHRSNHKSKLTSGLVAAACGFWSCCAWAQTDLRATAAGKDDWIQFPPRPTTPLSKSTTDNPSTTPRRPSSSRAPQDGWIQFPALPAPRPDAQPLEPLKTSAPPVNPAPDLVESTARESTDFVFKAFKFEGNTVYSNNTLQVLLQTAIPTVKDVTDLQKAADTVAQRYQQDGVLARVDLLPQDLTHGEVLLTITEGRFAGAQLETPNSSKLPADYLVKLVETAQPPNEAVLMQQLDRATLLLGEVPGVQATMRLKSGNNDGQTLALLQVVDSQTWSKQVSWDNAGPVSTGINRFSTQLSRFGALGRADISHLQYQHSDGTDYLRLSYTEPLGYWGSRWGANASASHYQIVTSEYQALNPQGPATSLGLDMTWPLLRSRTSSANLQVAADHKYFRNTSSLGVISAYDMDTFSTSLQGVRSDDWRGGGETNAGAQLTHGRVDFSRSPTESSDIAGHFTKLRLNMGRQQTLSPTTQLVGTYQMQMASKNLDSSEKFSLGGMQALRAYSATEANGDVAKLLTVEFQQALEWQKQPFKLSGFLDSGYINRSKISSGSGINSYKLQGAGMWVGSTVPNRWGQTQWRLTWARRLGTNPAAQASGLDLDGTLQLNRFWLSVMQQFEP